MQIQSVACSCLYVCARLFVRACQGLAQSYHRTLSSVCTAYFEMRVQLITHCFLDHLVHLFFACCEQLMAAGNQNTARLHTASLWLITAGEIGDFYVKYVFIWRAGNCLEHSPWRNITSWHYSYSICLNKYCAHK